MRFQDDGSVTPIARPGRLFDELVQVQRRVARVELQVTIALAMSTGLVFGLLAYIARALAN